jgi:hypothetical protein
VVKGRAALTEGIRRYNRQNYLSHLDLEPTSEE